MNISPVQKTAALIKRHQLLKADSKLVVAVSGGIDSTALLHILAELDMALELIVVYVDHSLRPAEITTEITHVKEQAESFGARFLVRKIDTIAFQKSQKKSPEEAARILRYQALQQILKEYKADYICVGHTADDQVEEFFLRGLRGSGKAGLSGMSVKRDNILRPLLNCSKKELAIYLDEKGIKHTEDSSNSERQYTRNRVRLDLLPILEELNPSIRKTVLNNIDILQEEEDLLSALSKRHYSEVVSCDPYHKDNLVLDLTSFCKLHIALQRRLLETICWKKELRPAFTLLEKLLNFAKRSEKGKTLTLEKGLRVTRLEQSLLFHNPFQGSSSSRLKAPERKNISVTIKAPGCFKIAELGYSLRIDSLTKQESSTSNLLIDRQKLTFPLQLRYAKPGERFNPVNGNGSKKVNRYLTEKKIRPDLRKLYPVLVSATNIIIAIPGLTISDQVKIDENSQEILSIEWFPVN